jgi:hypothetical protein
MNTDMRIAQIAPPWIPIPPKQYGGTEIVIYHLVEEQVAQGLDVTLFAPGDAKSQQNWFHFTIKISFTIILIFRSVFTFPPNTVLCYTV